eukprot:CAMPEP_0197897044 /NCGR_PEP_ID=MMETSP1439-20131203/41518_1 /TAXON_ID=66791 /ORGANISM="Gonyaulax spinifera, Strain CCMP409" /LENGTH=77 /DNA_ID=CAMNT_0043517639 /DNA_START=1 /DNA_END=75 /DNA_ORIENTATION=+
MVKASREHSNTGVSSTRFQRILLRCVQLPPCHLLLEGENSSSKSQHAQAYYQLGPSAGSYKSCHVHIQTGRSKCLWC